MTQRGSRDRDCEGVIFFFAVQGSPDQLERELLPIPGV